MSYIIHITRGGILIADGAALGSAENGAALLRAARDGANKSDGSNAVNGFDALADLDSNANGQLSAADLAWGSLQVWRDLDQNGLSTSEELVRLADLDILRVGVAGSPTKTSGGIHAGIAVNGNLIAQSANSISIKI